MEKRGYHKYQNIKDHPALSHKWTLGEKAADKLTTLMGSWIFIITFICFLFLWVSVNAYFLIQYKLGKPWDPYPFILLNLILSTIAALQAPVILMSQNREAQKDRIRSQYDYTVNRKAEREIEQMQQQLNRIERKLSS